MYFEVQPAYGRDYKNKAAVIADFAAGKDFVGDYQLNFGLVSKDDFKAGDTVNLRYNKLRSVAPFKVK